MKTTGGGRGDSLVDNTISGEGRGWKPHERIKNVDNLALPVNSSVLFMCDDKR